jgi:hypothetical protein
LITDGLVKDSTINDLALANSEAEDQDRLSSPKHERSLSVFG